MVIPVDMSATVQPSPTQSQAGTLEIANPSTVSASPSTGKQRACWIDILTMHQYLHMK